MFEGAKLDPAELIPVQELRFFQCAEAFGWSWDEYRATPRFKVDWLLAMVKARAEASHD